MEVPPHWSCHGGGDRLVFVPAAASFAEASIQAVDLPGPQPLDEAAIAALVRQALADAPPASQAVTLVEQVENPIILEGNLSVGITISYQTLGRTFRRSTIVVNCPQRRLILRFTAPEKEFDALNTQFRRAVTSWSAQPARS
jgi:hypothetical protein